MKITVLTLFPEMFMGPFDYSIVKKAREKKLVEINFVNIRKFGIGRHKTVDNKPYGGGHGMILRVDVLEKAIKYALDKKLKKNQQKVILLDPHGKTFNQGTAQRLSLLKHLILICGHYEGIDERIRSFIDEEISIGDFITTGGEMPAMLMVDSITRLVKGVLKDGVTSSESFSDLLEYPQYTKPNIYKKMLVPPILLGGNHNKIANWRKSESEKITSKLRPELLKK
jgi:tRNA (guanine37-N1)-methyltransferase